MQAQERFYTKPKEIPDVSPLHQITWVGMSHSPCGTSNCFFSLAVVQGFPKLFFHGAGCQWVAAAQECPTVLREPLACGAAVREGWSSTCSGDRTVQELRCLRQWALSTREPGGDEHWVVLVCECTLCVCMSVHCHPSAPLPPHTPEPSLLEKGSSSSLVQGKKESEGKHLALTAAFTAQTSLPCFLQVSRESGSATALLLAESSSCTAFKGFANHQWYTSIWEPLV